jgi:very-short-patch-repair endonuclease
VGGFSDVTLQSPTQAQSSLLAEKSTDAELHLWQRLRRKQILGVQFYRQKPIGNYIADFYTPAAKLVL